jgi:hypothetical protein
MRRRPSLPVFLVLWSWSLGLSLGWFLGWRHFPWWHALGSVAYTVFVTVYWFKNSEEQ